jgi:hypothetical protein
MHSAGCVAFEYGLSLILITLTITRVPNHDNIKNNQKKISRRCRLCIHRIIPPQNLTHTNTNTNTNIQTYKHKHTYTPHTTHTPIPTHSHTLVIIMNTRREVLKHLGRLHLRMQIQYTQTFATRMQTQYTFTHIHKQFYYIPYDC